MAWLLLVLVVVIIVWVHCARGMSFRDRISAALDTVDSTNFEPAEGFDAARREDTDLVGWARANKDCVMLFRSQQGDHVKEVIDVASDNFHPSLILHFEDGRAIRTDEGELNDPRLKSKAEELLRRVRMIMQKVHPPQLDNYDGSHY